MKIECAVCSDIGRFRKSNQDNYYLNGIIKERQLPHGEDNVRISSPWATLAVCDGMGGEQYGEFASSIAVNLLKEQSSSSDYNEFNSLLNRMNDEICKFSAQKKCYSGTTFAGIFLEKGCCKSVNVGDSRNYYISGNSIVQLSTDHTEFQMMVDLGKLCKDDYSHSSLKSHLTQHLGISPSDMLIQPTVAKVINLKPGDYFLICSDGIFGAVNDTQILEIVSAPGNTAEKCRKLVNQAIRQGSRDNVTALIIKIEFLDDDDLENQRRAESRSDNPILSLDFDYFDEDTVELTKSRTELSTDNDAEKAADEQKAVRENKEKNVWINRVFRKHG